MEKLLSELVDRLREAYGSDLISVVLHGSAARSSQHTEHSDLNTICILRNTGIADLRKGSKAFQWWEKQKQPFPLLLSAEEVRESHDVFPIEYIDIQRSHRVLHGDDLFTSIQVDRRNHRAQVEYELRSSILRLRQRYLGLHPSDREVTQLMVKSISSVATLARHALILAANGANSAPATPAHKAEVFDAASARFGLNVAPFHSLLRIRQGREKISGDQVHSLFAAYVDQIVKLADAVDQL